MYEVVSPVGETTIARVVKAPLLPSDLNGKTVGEIAGSGTGFKYDVTFPIIRELLHQRYPGVKVIPYTEFPVQNPSGFTTEQLLENAEATAALARQKGCDAVIVGNAG